MISVSSSCIVHVQHTTKEMISLSESLISWKKTYLKKDEDCAVISECVGAIEMVVQVAKERVWRVEVGPLEINTGVMLKEIMS